MSHDESMEVTRFAVYAAPRTGSNWLCSLLDSHPEILCHHEIFNPDKILYSIPLRSQDFSLGTLAERDHAPALFLDKVWNTPMGHQFIGIKLNRGQNHRIFNQVLRDSPVKKIILRRRNRILAYVSEQIATQTGRWEHYAWSEDARITQKVTVNVDDLMCYAKDNGDYYKKIIEILAGTGQEYLETYYEELDRQVERQRILAYIGVDQITQPLETLTKKQGGMPLQERIMNLAELQDELHGTILEMELESALGTYI